MVGATSRPDMLDAALLRPGRLDRLLYCGFPNARERLQVHAAWPPRPAAPGSCMPRKASFQSTKLSHTAHARVRKLRTLAAAVQRQAKPPFTLPLQTQQCQGGCLQASPVALYRTTRICLLRLTA